LLAVVDASAQLSHHNVDVIWFGAVLPNLCEPDWQLVLIVSAVDPACARTIVLKQIVGGIVRLGGKEQSRIQLSNLRQELIPCIPTGRLAVLRS
jgi:hypothetical protein